MLCHWCRTPLDPEKAADIDHLRLHRECVEPYLNFCRDQRREEQQTRKKT